jgi:hypothetical protein
MLHHDTEKNADFDMGQKISAPDPGPRGGVHGLKKGLHTSPWPNMPAPMAQTGASAVVWGHNMMMAFASEKNYR